MNNNTESWKFKEVSEIVKLSNHWRIITFKNQDKQQHLKLKNLELSFVNGSVRKWWLLFNFSSIIIWPMPYGQIVWRISMRLWKFGSLRLKTSWDKKLTLIPQKTLSWPSHHHQIPDRENNHQIHAAILNMHTNYLQNISITPRHRLQSDGCNKGPYCLCLKL